MRKFMRNMYELLNSKIKYQLFILFTILNLFILSVMYLTVIKRLSHLLVEEKYDSMMTENKYIESLLEQYLRDLGKSSLNYYYSKEMIDILSSTRSSSDLQKMDAFNNNYSLNLFLTGILEMSSEIDGVYLYSLDGSYVHALSRNTLSVHTDPVDQADWFRYALARHGKNILLGRTKSLTSGENVIAMCRSIINPDNYKNIGVVYIELNLAGLGRLFGSTHLETTNYILITDSQEQLIYTNQEAVGQSIMNIPGWNQTSETNYWLHSSDGHYYLVHSQSAYTGWHIYTCTAKEELYHNITIIREIFRVVLLLCVILTFILSYSYSSVLSAVLHKIIAAMKEFENGNTGIRFQIRGRNEINQLKIGFNSLTARIHQLIEQEYKIKIWNQEMEIQLLKKQINPHFLYNALGMISNQAEKEASLRTSRMCVSLAELFRYNLGKEGDIVTFAEELENIKNYLSLQEERFCNKLTCVYEINSVYYPIKLPRMTLQPLVENAIIHGIEETDKRCCIIISLKEKADRYILSISNTGKTLSESEVDEINRRLRTTNNDFSCGAHSGIGIYNVNARLTYYFPGSYLSFAHTKVGACVEIILTK